MSTGTPRDITRNQIIVDYNFEKAFLFDNNYSAGEYTNSTGSEVTLNLGRVMGRIAADGKLLPLDSTATDGSQFPVGILAETVTVADGASATLNFCVAGEINENVLSFTGAETLDTIVDSRQLRDRIAGDTEGIKLVTSIENTNFDN